MPAKVVETLCTGCRTCERNCPAGAAHVVAGKARVDPALCTECETCMDNCMQGALTMVAAGASAAED